MVHLSQTLTAIGEIVTGQRGTEELGGPVRIAQMSNEFGQAGLRALFYFMIILSINLGLLNLLPVGFRWWVSCILHD